MDSSQSVMTMEPNRSLMTEDQPTPQQPATASRVALAVFVVMGLLLAITSGLWATVVCLLVMCVNYGTFVVRCVVRPRFSDELDFPAQRALALTLLFFSVILCVHPCLLYTEYNVCYFALVLLSICLLAVSLRLALASVGRWSLPTIGYRRLVLAAWVCLVTLRLLVIGAAPEPQIDVFYTDNSACDRLLEGTNPYSAEYVDIYHGKFGFQPTFFYWPATLYWNLPFRGLLGDVRFGTVLADALTAVCLLLAARRTSLPRLAVQLVPLVWLAFPVGLFVVEEAWVDPLLIVGTAAAMVMLERRQWWLCGMALGCVAATKQYGGLVGVLTLAWLAGRDLRATWRTALAAAVTFAGLMAPMVCWDPGAFYHSTIKTYIHAAGRKDSLGIPAFFLQYELAPPLALCGAVTLSMLAALALGCLFSRDAVDRPRRLAANLAAAFWTSFLFGKFSFCNYYYLVSFLVFAFFVVSLPRSAAVEPSRA